MEDHDLLRFNRQILLPQIDIEGQHKLADARVTVIGLGGLGCPVATYLAAAGVGHLTLIDHDNVELTNLQRQLAYTDLDIGKAKATVLTRVCSNINPKCQIKAIKQKFNYEHHQSIIRATDIIIDATDNIASRTSINLASVKENKPLVFAAAIRMEGQLTVFDPRIEKSPCYECVFGHVQINESCSNSGVLGSVVGTLGLMQATEAVKLIIDIGQSPVGRLILFDALACDFQSIKISRKNDCSVCSNK